MFSKKFHYLFHSIAYSAVLFLYLAMSNHADALEVGETAPDLHAHSNLRLELENLKDNLVYIDFWASWCGSCQLSLSWMNELDAKYKDSKLRIIAVNLDKKKEDAEQLISNMNLSYAVKFDPEGLLASLYNPPSMPSSYLIGANGKILYIYKGFGDKHKLQIESDIEQAINRGKNEIP